MTASSTKTGCLSPQSGISLARWTTYSNRILSGMPAGVENLFGKVDAFCLYALFFATRLASAANLFRLECGFVGLQHRVVVAVDVVDSEIVVVRSGQDVSGTACSI